MSGAVRTAKPASKWMELLTAWLRAARPRTVLLSLSGILLGGSLAFFDQPGVHPWTLVFCASTAILLQILSNLANDYGDFKKGVDDAHRTGPQRTLQSGALTERQMRIGIALTVLLCLGSGLLLLLSVGLLQGAWNKVVVMAVVGLAAVAAALFYTLGKHPYGYRGLGDLFCFLFFGWVAVAGTYYLAAPSFDPWVLLPATAMGFLATGVLNINNLRDYENDRAHGKNTLVVKMGLEKAFTYHVFLIVLPFFLLTLFLMLKHVPWYDYAFWLLFPFFLMNLATIRKTLATGVPDRLLPKQVLQTFLLTLVWGITMVIERLFNT